MRYSLALVGHEHDENRIDQKKPTAEDVADYLLSLSIPGTLFAITPLKLQKLLYYCQGWHMAMRREVLFDDDFEAWDHGPVIRKIYFKYQKHQYLTIPKGEFTNKDSEGNNILSKQQLGLLDAVWEVYGEFDGKYLEQMTHQESPWIQTKRNEVIKKSLIWDYFISLKRDN